MKIDIWTAAAAVVVKLVKLQLARILVYSRRESTRERFRLKEPPTLPVYLSNISEDKHGSVATRSTRTNTLVQIVATVQKF